MLVKPLDDTFELYRKSSIKILSVNNRPHLLNQEEEASFLFNISISKGEQSSHLTFLRIEPDTFSKKLLLINSDLPNIMATMIRLSYLSGITKLSKLLKMLRQQNPLSYPSSQSFYLYKVKKMLLHLAYGIDKQFLENGLLDNRMSEMIVKEKGTLYKLLVYDIQKFQNILFSCIHLKISKQRDSSFLEIQPLFTFEN
jgi:hypothetical protein